MLTGRLKRSQRWLMLMLTRRLKWSQRLLVCCDVCMSSKDHWKGSDLSMLDFSCETEGIERELTIETMEEELSSVSSG